MTEPLEPPAPLEELPSEQPVNVLLVDDQPANLLALEAILQGLGHNLVRAYSGEEALRRLLEREFALVLLDVRMPGLDGFETAKHIRGREESRHTPIIFLTAFESDRFPVEQAYALGAVDYLVKPLVPVIVRAKVAGFVELYQKTQQVKRQAERIRQIERREFEERLARENAALREQREWLRVTLASIGDAVIATDTAGRVTFLNRVAGELTGWTEDEARGRPLEAVFHTLDEQTRQPVENPVAKVLREDAVVGLGNHAVLIARDGTERPIADSAAPIRDANGAAVGVVLTFRDVTAQRRAEREVRESAARKAAVLETALDCIITMDHEGRVVEFNPAAEKTFGYDRAAVAGRELAELLIPPYLREPYRIGFARYLATGEGPALNRRLELPALRADGTEFPVELAVTRIPTDGPPLFTAYLRDISDRARAEARRSARLAVTQVLAQAATTREAAVGVLQAVCESLGWDAGFFWTMDAEAGVLRCLESWHRPEVTITEFEATSRQRAFEKGRGLPGHVWAAGKPVWVLDVLNDDNFPRVAAAAREGLHGAFGCPLVLGTETLGVIEFFSRQIREPDRDLLEMMDTVAGQIGQFLERNRAEEKIRFQAHLLDAVGQAVIVTDPDGTIVYWNRFAERLYGWRTDEALGRNVIDVVVAPAAVAQAADIMGRLRAGEDWTGEIEVRRRDGTVFPAFVTDTPVFDEQGRLTAVIGISVDLTERKRVEQALRFLADASAALAAVVDYQSTLQKVAGLAVPHFADWCAVDMLEPDGSLRRLAVVHADPAKVRLAHEFHRRYPPEPDARHGVPQVVRTGASDMMEDIPEALLAQGAKDEDHLRLLRELGLKSYMCVPLKGRGKVLGVVSFVAAESGRRYTRADLVFAEELARRAAVAIENAQLYAELREADRLKDEFLAMLAHELRNPLAPVRNALHVMRQPGANGEMLQQVRDVAERQVQHMARLLDDLLDVSRISRGRIELRKEAVDVAAVLSRTVEAVRPLIEERRHELTLSLPAAALRVEADPTRLEQVLTNLLNNAAKYTDPGGHIELTAERTGDEVVIRVGDTGIGIAPEMLPRIFDLFVQAERRLDRAQGGIGIGLTLVKKLVELHGGRIEAASGGLGQGSEFVVRLSALADERPCEGARTAEQGEAAALPGRRIVVVDDNQDAADSLALLLRLVGQDVRTAYDGPTGLDQVQAFRPDLVFLDIGMPGMDGYEVARRLRQQPDLKDVLLVALTGWGQEEDRRRSREAGFHRHLVKPVEPSALEALLADVTKR
jgi:PAS domain S-box-containing protein